MLAKGHSFSPTGLSTGRIILDRALFVIICLLVPVLAGTRTSIATATSTARPFSLPFTAPPGLNSWLFEEPYGNTVEAYNLGKYWYAAGQRLHFGIDLEAPCGTPIVAMADGVVDWVDNGSFGAAPHNLVLRYPDLGYTSVYGHLLTKPTVLPGQVVRRGEIVAHSGDPDYNCHSRPHLHLEIHSLDYRIGYDPLTLIDADWEKLYTLTNSIPFAKDLAHPNRWQTFTDQPLVHFNDWPLNIFSSWPPPMRLAPPPTTLPDFAAPPINAVEARKLTADGCCTLPWWSADGRAVRYLDGPDGELASIMTIGISDSTAQRIGNAPPMIESPDGSYSVRENGGAISVTRTADGKTYALLSQSTWPAFSPDSSRLLWQVRPGDYITGSALPRTEIWIANVDGTDRQLIRTQTGGSVRWLDRDRLLIVETPLRSEDSTLGVYTISTKQYETLAVVKWLHGLSVAPGGKYLMFYLPFQAIPANSGVYLLETAPSATPHKLPFVGGWHWRDDHSVLYLSFDLPNQQDSATLTLYDVISGQQTVLSHEPLMVANADWEVSPNGRYVVYLNAQDNALWLLDLRLLV